MDSTSQDNLTLATETWIPLCESLSSKSAGWNLAKGAAQLAEKDGDQESITFPQKDLDGRSKGCLNPASGLTYV